MSGQENILVIGGGGREHTQAYKLAQSEHVAKVFVAPGNAGTSLEHKCVNVPIDGAKKENFKEILKFVNENNVSTIVVGPEQPLVDGIADYCKANGFNRVFGPNAHASQLESSKIFSYDLMENLGIPQAFSMSCSGHAEAIKAVKEIYAEYGGVVLKADGLTGGKGVLVADGLDHALAQLPLHLKKYCPDGKILIAQKLVGEEFSLFGFADGKRVVPIMMSAQDHKRLFDNDEGPNTGGMGAYCPAPVAPSSLVKAICDTMMTPIAEALGFVGFIYYGGIKTKEGVKVIEYNIRFGDPEAQPVLSMVKSDLFELISAGLEGKLNPNKIEFYPGAACCVVLAARGYPEDVSGEKGKVIYGIEAANALPGVKVFHAGTKLDAEGRTVINGGRVLGSTGYSPDGLLAAQIAAYRGAAIINEASSDLFHYRKEIGKKGLEKR